VILSYGTLGVSQSSTGERQIVLDFARRSVGERLQSNLHLDWTIRRPYNARHTGWPETSVAGKIIGRGFESRSGCEQRHRIREIRDDQ
jgi:hypothetical protein